MKNETREIKEDQRNKGRLNIDEYWSKRQFTHLFYPECRNSTYL